MTIASGARSRVAYVAETVPGTTPATPAFNQIRVTSGGIRTHKTTKTITEIAADRNIRDEVNPYQSGSVSYNFALHYGAFDDILQQALFGTWTTNVLKNGLVRNFATFEETYQFGASQSFSRLTMGMVDTFNLEIAAQSEITGSFGVIGQKETIDTVIVTGATYVAPSTEAVMSAGLGVGALTVAGLTAPKIKKISLAIKNNAVQRPLVDSLYSDEFGEGMFDVTGSMEMYFSQNAAYQKVLDHGGGALSMTLGVTTLKKYTVALPQIVFLDGARSMSGPNADVMVTIPFRAKYDSSSASTMSITRGVA
ncbi:MAG: phage tail protein [Rhodoplanes sp.]|uniref:phage tail tube protein n=1 Tax=Rhodoplanes sp. TaxID=1968906 RepID=UPI0017A6C437|nr:phage tail tube protein [Rhodoplanes sp.]NVO13900.1 phage tail protein [Rhodoplanes sp.]